MVLVLANSREKFEKHHKITTTIFVHVCTFSLPLSTSCSFFKRENGDFETIKQISSTIGMWNVDCIWILDVPWDTNTNTHWLTNRIQFSEFIQLASTLGSHFHSIINIGFGPHSIIIHYTTEFRHSSLIFVFFFTTSTVRTRMNRFGLEMIGTLDSLSIWMCMMYWTKSTIPFGWVAHRKLAKWKPKRSNLLIISKCFMEKEKAIELKRNWQ